MITQDLIVYILKKRVGLISSVFITTASVDGTEQDISESW